MTTATNTHTWKNAGPMHWVRTPCGREGDNLVACISVNIDIYGEAFVSVQAQKKLKSRDEYISKGAPSFHCLEDLEAFNCLMLEAHAIAQSLR